MKTRIIILYLFLLASLCSWGKDMSKDKVAKSYLDMIGIHQVGIGMNVSYWNNVHSGVAIHYLLGSSRNLFNLNMGVGYQLCVPTKKDISSSLFGHYIPINLGVRCNYARWEHNCAYIAAESTCNFNVGNKQLHRTYFSLGGGLGLRFNALDVFVLYSYDLKPSFGQQYIYEHPEYNFETLRQVIYERMHLGVRLVYYFTIQR